MRPDQFVRDPARWLRAAAGARHTVSPSFGLAYASRRLTQKDIEDIDLSRLRTVVVGAEPIDPDHLKAFAELTAAQGFSPTKLLPSYGLAEHTLLATAHRRGEPHRMIRIDKSALRHGQPVRVLAGATDCTTADQEKPKLRHAVGVPIPGHDVRIAHDPVRPLRRRCWAKSSCPDSRCSADIPETRTPKPNAMHRRRTAHR